MVSSFVFMQFSILGGSHIITLDKNVIEGAQRGKTGLIGNIDNTCVGTLQKLNCILQSQAVDIVWKTDSQHIAEQMANMAFADLQSVRNLCQRNRFPVS